MMKPQKVTLKELREAFEVVIPGFYDAWREATNRSRERREPNPRRIYANSSERLLTVYQAEREAAHKGREEIRDQLALGAADIHFYNRGYVPLLAARFPSSDVAWADLRAMDVRNRPQAEWDGWFANDPTPLVERWLVTMAVLRYVRENATTITPTWKSSHGCSLAQSS